MMKMATAMSVSSFFIGVLPTESVSICKITEPFYSGNRVTTGIS